PPSLISPLSLHDALPIFRLHGIESFLLQLVRVDFCRQSDAAAFLAHVNQNAVTCICDLPQRCVQLISAITSARSENVSSETLTMHAYQRRFVFLDFAFHQREMMLTVNLRAI